MKTINAVIRVAASSATPETDDDFAYMIAVAPLDTGVIIINYPGYNGSLSGYRNKYINIAGLLLGEGVGSVVLTHNLEDEHTPFQRLSVARLHHLIGVALLNAEAWCGSVEPDIYLMGHSAGASAICAVLSEYSQVKKVLLTSPSANAGSEMMERGLMSYRGELYVTVGQKESSGFIRTAKAVAALATQAKQVSLVEIPDCDHEFTGERNGRILSQSRLWAFAGDTTFPNPENGIFLYR